MTTSDEEYLFVARNTVVRTHHIALEGERRDRRVKTKFCVFVQIQAIRGFFSGGECDVGLGVRIEEVISSRELI